MPSTSPGRDESEDPAPSGQSSHSLAWGGRDSSAPTPAEGPGFLSSLPSLQPQQNRNSTETLHRGLGPSSSFKDGKDRPELMHRQLLLLQEPGGGLPVLGFWSLLPQSHLCKAQLAPGDRGRTGGRGLQEQSPRDGQGPGSHPGGAYLRYHCHLSQMRGSEAQVSEGACPSMRS